MFALSANISGEGHRIEWTLTLHRPLTRPMLPSPFQGEGATGYEYVLDSGNHAT